MAVHLVVGARGFAGRHVATALAGHVRVRCAEPGDDLGAALRGVEVVYIGRELRSPLDRRGWWAQPRPHPLLARVAGAATAAGVRRLVHVSSANVYGYGERARVRDGARPRPDRPYERLLAFDERWLRERAAPEVVVLRPAQPFGPGEPLGERLLGRLNSGRLALPAGGHSRRTFLAGPDLGRACLAAGLRGRPGCVYLAGGFEGCWRDLLMAAAAAAGLAPRLGRCSYDVAYLTAAAGLPWPPARGDRWPAPYAVDLVGRPQLVEDSDSRRELSWEPEILTFEDGFAASSAM